MDTIDGLEVISREERAKMPYPKRGTDEPAYSDKVATLTLSDGSLRYACKEEGCDHVATAVQGVTIGHRRIAHGIAPVKEQSRRARWNEILEYPFGEIVEAAKANILGRDALMDRLTEMTADRDKWKKIAEDRGKEIDGYQKTFSKLAKVSE